MHRLISSLVLSLVPKTSSALKDLKKLSPTALSQQFPLRLMPCVTPKDFRTLTVCLHAYCPPPIRMKDHAFSELPVLARHHNGRDDGFSSTHAFSDGPAYRFTVEKV